MREKIIFVCFFCTVCGEAILASYYPVDPSSQNEYSAPNDVAEKCWFLEMYAVVVWYCGRIDLAYTTHTHARTQTEHKINAHTHTHTHTDTLSSEQRETQTHVRVRIERFTTSPVNDERCACMRETLFVRSKMLTTTGARTSWIRVWVFFICMCVRLYVSFDT